MSLKDSTAGKTVLALDVDGVLVHPLDGLRTWDARIADDLGIDPKLLSQLFFKRRWRPVVLGQKDLKAELAQFLAEVRSSVTAEEFVDYWFKHDGRVDEAVLAEASRWRGGAEDRAIIAVSNQEKYRVTYLWDVAGLGKLLEGGLWSCQLGLSKSDPEFYARANNDLVPHAHAIVFFDDEPKHVELASRAGWRSYVYRSADDFAAQLCHTA